MGKIKPSQSPTLVCTGCNPLHIQQLSCQVIHPTQENQCQFLSMCFNHLQTSFIGYGLIGMISINKQKNLFNGKAKMVETGVRSKCCTLLIDGPSDADPWGKEALLLNGEKIGRLTSGGYSVAFGKQIGMGYVRPDLAEVGTKLKVRMNRELWDAVVVEDSPFDPSNARIRIDG